METVFAILSQKKWEISTDKFLLARASAKYFYLPSEIFTCPGQAGSR